MAKSQGAQKLGQGKNQSQAKSAPAKAQNEKESAPKDGDQENEQTLFVEAHPPRARAWIWIVCATLMVSWMVFLAVVAFF